MKKNIAAPLTMPLNAAKFLFGHSDNIKKQITPKKLDINLAVEGSTDQITTTTVIPTTTKINNTKQTKIDSLNMKFPIERTGIDEKKKEKEKEKKKKRKKKYQKEEIKN